MVAIPELDNRLYEAPAFRVKSLRPWSPKSSYGHLATPGEWMEYSRDDLKRLAGRAPFKPWLAGLFFDDEIYCEARLDDEWQVASWWRVRQIEHVASLVRFIRQSVAAPDDTNVFRQEGEGWTVSYRGKTAGIKARNGMTFLAHLLAHPNEAIAATHLASLVDGTAAGDGKPTEPELVLAGGTQQLLLDPQTVAELRLRVNELQAEEADAVRSSDSDRAIGARTDREKIEDYLSKSLGRAGRSRTFAADSERARTRVTKQIDVAIEKIEAHHPGLGAHLRNSVSTGRTCCYAPEAPVDWRL